MQVSAVTICDIVIAVWLVLSTLYGAVQGLILQLGRIAALAAAWILAMLFTAVIGSYFGMTFLISYIVLSVLFRLALQILNLVDRIPVIGFLNHIGGAICGFLLAFVLIYLLVSLVYGVLPPSVLEEAGITETTLEHSLFLGAFVP